MGTRLLTEKYETEIQGILHCYDRVVISGNLQPLCYAKGMTKYLYEQGIWIFDYSKQFAEPLRNLIRENTEKIAAENGLEIEFITKKDAFRKEERIKKIIAARGMGAARHAAAGGSSMSAQVQVQASALPIEPAGLRDLWKLRQLEKLTFNREDAWPLVELLFVLVSPGIVRLKVDYNGQMIAFVAGETRASQGMGWIITLGVAPAWRCQGLGERLLAAAEQALHIPVIRLTVRASNQAAIALYQKAGYRKVGVSHRYYVGGEDGWIFEKHSDAL